MALDPLPRQRLAIEAPPGPVLVIAGPGAGKTFCLITRIAHLVDKLGVQPERVCAVTFTNRAAEEIAVRLKHTLRGRAEAITRGTIHALCLSLLREHAEAAGLRKGLGVADEQSIFTWTGADPYVLVRFARDYGIEQPIVLDKNCRCSRQIFETARRVLAHNPQLFEKQLSADQESPYEVGAFAFRDEAEEAAWMLEDIRSDRAAAGLGWGDYPVLYRRHQLGEYPEGRLLRAGTHCRLARGPAPVRGGVPRPGRQPRGGRARRSARRGECGGAGDRDRAAGRAGNCVEGNARRCGHPARSISGIRPVKTPGHGPGVNPPGRDARERGWR